MANILLHLLPATLYLALAWACHGAHAQATNRKLMLALLPAAIVAHALALSETLFANAGLNLGFASSLSLTLWLAMLVYGLESLLTPLPQLLRIAAPVAAAASLLPLLLSGHPQTIALHGWAHKAHIVVALLAYGLYTLAIFHALLLVATERRLHRPPAPGQQAGLPLLTQERLLFRLVQTAFVFLSLTILSGALFSNEIFGKPFVLTHKAVFGFAAWALFAILLIGRHLRGWRGNTAIRWMLAGFFFLVLAYTGSRFVLEFVLGRSL